MHPILFHIGALVIPSYGAIVALGVLLALMIGQRTARLAGLDPREIWNLMVLALGVGLISARLLLVALNFEDLKANPIWMLGLASIHHPTLTAFGAALGLMAALVYAWQKKIPFRRLADVVATPILIALAGQQIACLLAGAEFGRPTNVKWAIVYHDANAAHWSGTPLGVPVHPVQVYAAVAYLLIALSVQLLASSFQPREAARQQPQPGSSTLNAERPPGTLSGTALILTGITLFLTEIFRDETGLTIWHGLDGVQWAALGLVIASLGLLWKLEGKNVG